MTYPLRDSHPTADDGYPQGGYAVPPAGSQAAGSQPAGSQPAAFRPQPGGPHPGAPYAGGPPPGWGAPAAAPRPATPDGRPLAEFSDRLLAYLIDAAILFGVNLVAAIPAVIGIVLVVRSRLDHRTVIAPDGRIVSTSLLSAGVILPVLGIYAGLILVGILVNYLYQVEFALRRGGLTVGKRTMKIKAVPLADSTAPVTRRMLSKRWLVEYPMALVVPAFSWIDGLWQLWDQPYKQCLHDKWAGTVVIKASA